MVAQLAPIAAAKITKASLVRHLLAGTSSPRPSSCSFAPIPNSLSLSLLAQFANTPLEPRVPIGMMLGPTCWLAGLGPERGAD